MPKYVYIILNPMLTHYLCNIRAPETADDQNQDQGQTTRRGGVHRLRTYRVARLPFEPGLLGSQDIVNNRHYLGPMDAICSDCDAQMWRKERTASSSAANPVFSLCCNSGKDILPLDQPPPPPLPQLLAAQTAQARDFRQRMRAYNYVFALSSLGVSYDKGLADARGGCFTFRIQGGVHHLISRSATGRYQGASRYAQIYFNDPEAQVDRRHSIYNNLDRDTLQAIQDMIHLVNPLARIYRRAHELLRAEPSANFNILLGGRNTVPAGEHPGRFAPPVSSEIAVLMLDQPVAATSNRHVLLIPKDGEEDLIKINELHPVYDPSHYVLMFPRGESGYTVSSEEAGVQSSMANYYAFKLMVRDGSYLLRYGRLLHQYMVDMYAKIEHARLRYIELHQDTIRCERLSSIFDATSGERMADIGRRTILPASFTGGPRDMSARYQDAMAMVRAFGKPDLFVTFICNPRWREIVENLEVGQSASDRPDLAVRVFRMKLDAMLDDIVKKQIFGEVQAYASVVEFQKRGLPHAHILIILHEADKPRMPEDYDTIVSAQLPGREAHPEAYATVTTMMMHGPCGELNSTAACMVDGSCSKYYPMEYCEETTVRREGYPQYKRPNNGRTARPGPNADKHDNKWVVPHNLWLVTKYDAHINVEVCATVAAVKYLYKYIFKGNDQAMVAMRQAGQGDQGDDAERDEVHEFMSCRYVAAHEADWRIFKFPLFHRSPSVQQLAIHLENEQHVTFRDGETREEVIARADLRKSTLLAFFALNQRDPQARSITYDKIPTRYTWIQSADVGYHWKRRSYSRQAVGRVYFVSPRESERYALRVLLHNVPGPTGFRDLKMVGGILYQTFQAAAEAHGLLSSDRELERCLDEAVGMVTNIRLLRGLFAMILLHCQPTNPGALWRYRELYFRQDYVYHQQQQ